MFELLSRFGVSSAWKLFVVTTRLFYNALKQKQRRLPNRAMVIMSDLSITGANVGVATSTTKVAVIEAAEAITRGMAVYRNGSNSNKATKAINTATASTAVYGIAISESAADGDFIAVATSGTVISGASMTVGQAYYLSNTAGGIGPFADFSTSEYINLLYRATTATKAKLVLENSGVQSP